MSSFHAHLARHAFIPWALCPARTFFLCAACSAAALGFMRSATCAWRRACSRRHLTRPERGRLACAGRREGRTRGRTSQAVVRGREREALAKEYGRPHLSGRLLAVLCCVLDSRSRENETARHLLRLRGLPPIPDADPLAPCRDRVLLFAGRELCWCLRWRQPMCCTEQLGRETIFCGNLLCDAPTRIIHCCKASQTLAE